MQVEKRVIAETRKKLADTKSTLEDIEDRNEEKLMRLLE